MGKAHFAFLYLLPSLGLVAVLLYHDGRRCLLSALRTLLQSREGLTWTLELDEEMSDLVMTFTKQMLDEGKVNRIKKTTGCFILIYANSYSFGNSLHTTP